MKHFISSGDLDSARDLLTYLWQMENAPFFRDPAGIAAGLGLNVPMTYEEWKERRQADETKAKQEKRAAAESDTIVIQAESGASKERSEEMVKWQAAYDFTHSGLSQAGTQSLDQLRGWGAAADGVAGSLANYWTQWLANEHRMSRYRAIRIPLVTCAVVLILGIGAFACALGPQLVNPDSDIFFGLTIYGVLYPILGIWELLALGVCLPLIVAVNNRKSKTLERTLKNQIDNQVNYWMSLSEPEHTRRLSNIESELQRLTNVAQAQYQQRMDAIAAEHARTLAEIEARYAGG